MRGASAGDVGSAAFPIPYPAPASGLAASKPAFSSSGPLSGIGSLVLEGRLKLLDCSFQAFPSKPPVVLPREEAQEPCSTPSPETGTHDPHPKLCAVGRIG